MNKDVKELVKRCVECHGSKIHRHITAPLSLFELPANRFGEVHMDIVYSLPQSNGFKYQLIMVNR